MELNICSEESREVIRGETDTVAGDGFKEELMRLCPADHLVYYFIYVTMSALV